MPPVLARYMSRLCTCAGCVVLTCTCVVVDASRVSCKASTSTPPHRLCSLLATTGVFACSRFVPLAGPVSFFKPCLHGVLAWYS